MDTQFAIMFEVTIVGRNMPFSAIHGDRDPANLQHVTYCTSTPSDSEESLWHPEIVLGEVERYIESLIDRFGRPLSLSDMKSLTWRPVRIMAGKVCDIPTQTHFRRFCGVL